MKTTLLLSCIVFVIFISASFNSNNISSTTTPITVTETEEIDTGQWVTLNSGMVGYSDRSSCVLTRFFEILWKRER